MEVSMFDLKSEFEKLIGSWELAGPKKMFGYEVYAANRKMFGWLEEDGIALTALPEEAREIVMNTFDTYPFQHGNRIFRSWLIVSVSNKSTFRKLTPFIELSYRTAFEASLNPKPEKTSTKKRLRYY